jgi:hypothetical protein
MTVALHPDLQPAEWVVAEECPLCEAPASAHAFFEGVVSEMERLSYRICRHCGFVFQSPHPSRDWLRGYYRAGYHLHMHGQHDPSPKTAWVESRRAEHLLDFAAPYLDDVQMHLDIGSSLGALLNTFHSAFGCQSYGVEPAEVFRRSAKSEGIQVLGSLSDLDRGLANTFDLVSLSHVLEHMADPLGTLRRINHEWMAEHSHLLVEVPNLFGHRSLEFSHLFAFTRNSLEQILTRAGFKPLSVTVHGRPHSRRLPFYISALARRVSEPMTYSAPHPSIAWIRMRRRLGMLRLRATWAVTSRLLGRSRLTPWAS